MARDRSFGGSAGWCSGAICSLDPMDGDCSGTVLVEVVLNSATCQACVMINCSRAGLVVGLIRYMVGEE